MVKDLQPGLGIMRSMVKAFDIFGTKRSAWILIVVAVLLLVRPEVAAAFGVRLAFLVC